MQRMLLVSLAALALSAPSMAQGAAQTVTADVNCNLAKIGEMRLTVDPYNTSRVVAGQTIRSFGAGTKGGFQLMNAALRDANCWCDSFRWFQAVDITQMGVNLGAGAPTFGFGKVADPFPTTPIQWGGGVTTGDFYPFYWGVPKGKCGHNSATGRNPIPGAPGKTWDLYYEDGPGLTANEANLPANFSVTFDFVTCLACVGTPLRGDGKNSNGTFKVLSAIRWSVTMTRTVANGFTSTIGAPVVVAPGALPAFVGASLTNFNGRPNVGTWTLGGACAPCPPPKLPPLTPRRPLDPGLAFPIVPMRFDASTNTLEIPAMLPVLLDDSGLDGPLPPQYLGDPVLDSLLGSMSFHYMGQFGQEHLFINDTQGFNLHLDDPFDLPDQTLFGDPLFLGNPNGWESFLGGRAPVLLYDPQSQVFTLPIYDPYIDPLGSPFLQDLGQAILPQNLPLSLAPASTLRDRIVPSAPPTDSTADCARPSNRRTWADLLERTFAVDVLRCPHCGDRRRIAVITDPLTCRKLLRHIGARYNPLLLAPARPPPQQALRLGEGASLESSHTHLTSPDPPPIRPTVKNRTLDLLSPPLRAALSLQLEASFLAGADSDLTCQLKNPRRAKPR